METLQHAPAGGVEQYGRHYRAGEFTPFYVPRPEMPQIDEADYPQLVSDALASGVGVQFDTVEVASLYAHQRIDHKRAQGMDPRVKMKPIIISNDGYIVDGNHRWWAHVHSGDSLINVIRLGATFDDAIAWALGRPYVYRITPATPIRN